MPLEMKDATKRSLARRLTEWAALLAMLSLCNLCSAAEAAACDGDGALGKQMTISGACERISAVNGAYTLQGTTADGREYYVNGNGQYLFYDSNCGGDAETYPAFWHIAPAKPSTTATTDLAGDGGTCAVVAHLTSTSRTLPSNASWQMACAAGTFVDTVLSIAAPTCICKLGYSGENCETGSAPPACDGDGALGKQMTISGACEYNSNSYVNGAYTLQGTTADGREYYANGYGHYLFYDSNCGGDAKTVPARWKIAYDKPSTTATTDLAGDGGTCAVVAYLASTSRTLPSSAAWRMRCAGGTVVDTVLSIAAPTCICKLGYSGENCETGSAPPACDGDGALGKQLVVSGACERQSSLNGVYALQGKIADGTEYFMNGEGDSLYYETDCTGTPAKWVFGDAARWVFDNTKATTNLANVERGCVSSGYLPSDYTIPPAEAKWRMACELDASFTPVNTATCKCNGKVNTDNQGGPDCSSISAQRPFCHTDVGACSDGRISGSVENTEYSYDVCGGEEYSDVAITIDPPTCICKLGYSGDNCEIGSAPPACDGDGVLGKQMTISGACEYRSSVNGVYTLEGTTADGREYYVNGNGQYLFYDADCGGDAKTYSAKWKIAIAKPSTTATTDLAGDGGKCVANAALASTARTLPSSATWQMACAAGTVVDTVLSIAAPTCICKLGYSGDNCEIGSAPPACDGDGVLGKQMTISGACERKSFVNGAYTLQGTTADGREYYVNGNGRYLFYDADCDGDAKTYSARWMIVNDKPNTTAATDLAGDGGTCGQSAYLASTARTLPSSATWQMACAADTFVGTVLSIAVPTCICKLGYSGDNCEIGSAPPACDGDGVLGKQMTISGACERKSFVNGAYTLQGTTADGREYYVNGNGRYLFYDSNCGGDAGTSPAKWKIFDDKPSTTATTDLAGDGGTCASHAYLKTAARTLPSSETWQMFCAADGTIVGTVLSIAAPICTCKLGYSGYNCEFYSLEYKVLDDSKTCDDEATGAYIDTEAGCDAAASTTHLDLRDEGAYVQSGSNDHPYGCYYQPQSSFPDIADNVRLTLNVGAGAVKGTKRSGYQSICFVGSTTLTTTTATITTKTSTVTTVTSTTATASTQTSTVTTVTTTTATATTKTSTVTTVTTTTATATTKTSTVTTVTPTTAITTTTIDTAVTATTAIIPTKKNTTANKTQVTTPLRVPGDACTGSWDCPDTQCKSGRCCIAAVDFACTSCDDAGFCGSYDQNLQSKDRETNTDDAQSGSTPRKIGPLIGGICVGCILLFGASGFVFYYRKKQTSQHVAAHHVAEEIELRERAASEITVGEEYINTLANQASKDQHYGDVLPEDDVVEVKPFQGVVFEDNAGETCVDDHVEVDDEALPPGSRPEAWFVGDMGKEKCKELVRAGAARQFLVRTSVSVAHGYVICFNLDGKHVQEDIVRRRQDGRYSIRFCKTSFTSIKALVLHWQNNKLQPKDRMAFILGQPVEHAISKFIGDEITLRCGESKLSATPLADVMGVNPKIFHVDDKVKAICSEFQKYGTTQDQDNLKRILDETYRTPESNPNDPPQHTPLSKVMLSKEAKDSGLQLWHVLVLQLYTTSCYISINKHLRESTQPNPFAITTFYISDALKRLRVHASSMQWNNTTRTYYRGMNNVKLSEDFMTQGGAEIGCMSTTSAKAVALSFAGGKCPLLLKCVSPSFMSHGASISFLSVYPGEMEVLYPPLTYLRPIKSYDEVVGNLLVTVVEVAPVYPG